MLRERKVRAVVRALGEPELRKGDELVFTCPRCSHRKPKLSVNVATDRFNCWVCSWKGKNLLPILRLRGNTDDVRAYVEHLEGPRPEVPARRYETPVLPPEFRPLSEPSSSPSRAAALAYLRSRGLGTSDVLRWRLGYCESGEYRNRVVVPSFDADGELNFFVGRSIYDGVRPYKHGEFDKDIVFNEVDIDWSRPVTVVEGPFDAMKAGENAVPLQGSYLRTGSKLFRRLVGSGQDVYMALDADAFEKQMDVITRLNLYDVRCLYVPLGGRKDVGEMTHAEFAERKARAVPVGSALDMLRVRVSA